MSVYRRLSSWRSATHGNAPRQCIACGSRRNGHRLDGLPHPTAMRCSMSDRVLSKYLSREEKGIDETIGPDSGSDGTEDLGAFGWMRGQRERSVMLELRKKTGDVLAVGYGWIERMEFNPSEGITLHCGRLTIRIKGRNL